MSEFEKRVGHLIEYQNTLLAWADTQVIPDFTNTEKFSELYEASSKPDWIVNPLKQGFEDINWALTSLGLKPLNEIVASDLDEPLLEQKLNEVKAECISHIRLIRSTLTYDRNFDVKFERTPESELKDGDWPMDKFGQPDSMPGAVFSALDEHCHASQRLNIDNLWTLRCCLCISCFSVVHYEIDRLGN